ncbi:MAG: hypothetical protein LBP81_03650 [Treponema sp.]|jgi:hypothetical protein|nr:hypothetical protein [Treponema sp.]
MKRRFVMIILAAPLFWGLLGSCMGVSSEITLGRDGSGTIKAEYRFARELESLGRQDGNQGRPPIPVGRTDIERTVARVPGMALKSFKSAVEGKDVVYRVTLNFADTDALIRFLDASGLRASVSRENSRNRLSLLLTGGGGRIEPELGELVSAASQGYFLALSFSLPSEAELALKDGEGRRLNPPQGWTLSGGRRPSFSAPVGEIFLFDGPLYLEIDWGL